MYQRQKQCLLTQINQEQAIQLPMNQALNQRGAIGQFPHPKFLKTCVFVRYSSKLHRFAPPKMSVGCSPAIDHNGEQVPYDCAGMSHHQDKSTESCTFSNVARWLSPQSAKSSHEKLLDPAKNYVTNFQLKSA